MESLKDKLKNFPARKVSARNYQAAYEVQADEIAQYFGKKQCFWLYRKWWDWQIWNAFKETRDRGKDWQYFMGILYKTKI